MTHSEKIALIIKSWAGTMILAALAAAAGYIFSLRVDPSGWSALPYALESALYTYGIGLGVLAYRLHPQEIRSPRLFNRIFFSVLSAFFAVIFFSEPLHLDFWPWLPYVLIIVLPLGVLGWVILHE